VDSHSPCSSAFAAPCPRNLGTSSPLNFALSLERLIPVVFPATLALEARPPRHRDPLIVGGRRAKLLGVESQVRGQASRRHVWSEPEPCLAGPATVEQRAPSSCAWRTLWARWVDARALTSTGSPFALRAPHSPLGESHKARTGPFAAGVGNRRHALETCATSRRRGGSKNGRLLSPGALEGKGCGLFTGSGARPNWGGERFFELFVRLSGWREGWVGASRKPSPSSTRVAWPRSEFFRGRDWAFVRCRRPCPGTEGRRARRSTAVGEIFGVAGRSGDPFVNQQRGVGYSYQDKEPG